MTLGVFVRVVPGVARVDALGRERDEDVLPSS